MLLKQTPSPVFLMCNVFISKKTIPENLPVIVLKPQTCKANLDENGVGVKERSEI